MPKPPKTHDDYHYNVTVTTNDIVVLGCLRAISAHAQQIGNKRIPWGGTKDTDWIRDSQKATFYFSDPSFRQSFIDEANRVLPKSLWSIVGQNDVVAAVPQK